MMSLEESISKANGNKSTKVIQTSVGYQGGTDEILCHEQVLNEDTEYHMVCKIVYNPACVELEDILHYLFSLAELYKPRENPCHQPIIFYSTSAQKALIAKFFQEWERKQQEEILARSSLQLVKKILTFYVILKTDELKVELRTKKPTAERKASLEKQIAMLQAPMTQFLKMKPQLLVDMVEFLEGCNKEFIIKLKAMGLFEKVKLNYTYYVDIINYDFKYTPEGNHLKEEDYPMVFDSNDYPFVAADREYQEYFNKKNNKSSVDLSKITVK